MREEPLSGGRNAEEIVRVGDTVRRARDPGSPLAAQPLGYLESAGYRMDDLWAEEAVRWASADRDLIRASEQILPDALR